jgi:hypothetical protein
MNTYLIPVYDAKDGIVWIEHITARNFNEAEEKFIEDCIETYNLIDSIMSFDDLIQVMWTRKQIIIGDIYDKDEF